MKADRQNDLIAFLCSRRAFGSDRPPAETISTHISTVLLLGVRAIKLKRQVRLSYVDLSSPRRRLQLCERELELNRRTAPALYRQVHRVTRERDGQLELNGSGELVDAVLEMRRFDGAMLFDRLVGAGTLSAAAVEDLAEAVAAFHRSAPVADDPDGAGRLRRVLDVNRRAFAAAQLPQDAVAGADTACRAALERHAALLDRRARDGFVRRVHGDLHLRNICLIDGRPTLFDCLEFDEDLATTDVLYDLAFVLMDLWHRGAAHLANILFNRELARRTPPGVTANALHPGFVATRFGDQSGGLMRAVFRVAKPIGAISPEEGAKTIIHLASSPAVEGITGEYFYECAITTPTPEARNDTDARRLWEMSASIGGVG